jgi:ammonia channel protein AmtB
LPDKNSLGMMVVGIFGKKDELEGFLKYDGLLHGGGFYLLGVQILACVCFMIWAGTITFTLIFVSTLVLFCYRRMVTSIYFMKLLHY